MPFDLRLRLYTDAGVKGRVLKTLKLDFTLGDSATAALRFSTSSRVAGVLEAPFLVGVEYSTGGAWVAPRNDLFIATTLDGDSTDRAGGAEFTAEAFVPWLLRHIHVWLTSLVVDGVRGYNNPGHAMKAIIDQGKAAGWGPNVTYDFSSTLDSNGGTWVAGEKPPDQNWLAPGTAVLSSMVDLGLCDWWTEGQKLRVFKASTTPQNRRTIRLGGKGYTRAPVKVAYEDVFTNLRVLIGNASDETSVALTNSGADTRFGSLWATLTQSGVTTVADATRLAAPVLANGKTVKRELSYEWNPAISGMPRPFADFNIGDTVTARTLGGWLDQRVVGLVVAKDENGVTCRAVVGKRLHSRQVKTIKRAQQATTGQIISGSGDNVPIQSPVGLSVPAAPTGLAATVNSASWNPDGSARTRVVLDWNDVAANVDGSGATIASYEVWSRLTSEVSQLLTTTTTSTAVVEGLWSPDVARFVKVRARRADGKLSAFSTEISVTPVSPTSIIPKAPTSLAAATNVGSFQLDGSALSTVRLTWAAVTQGTDNSALQIDAYELVDTTSAVEYWPRGVSKETFATVSFPAGQARKFRVRARSVFGQWGDYSTEITVTGASPTQTTTAPSAPTLSTALSMVVATWDGLLASGGLPIQFQNLITQRATASGGPWTDVGVPATRAGQAAAFKATVGETVWVRFLWRDTLGRLSNVSAATSIVVAGVSAPDIAAGTITANEIAAGTIEVSNLVAGFGGSLDISANDAVTTIIEQQSQASVDLAAAADLAQASLDEALAAAALAGDADAAAADAAVQAAAAAAEAASAAAAVAIQQTWFRVDAAGAHVGQSGNPFQANILPSEFNITENGVRMTWWQSGQMNVPSLVTTSVALSNHKFEKYGTGTVIRALG